MKKYSILLLLITAFSFAQKLTIEEATLGQFRQFAPKNLIALQWKKDTHAFTYLSADYQNLLQKSTLNLEKEEVLLTKTELENALKLSIITDEFSLKTFPFNYKWETKSILELDIQGHKNGYKIWIDTDKKTVQKTLQTPLNAAQSRISTSKKYTAFLDENNIKISDENGTITAVTADENKAIVNGSDYVHRQEFGIDRGMWWSPATDKLLYYRKDETMVHDYPLTNWDEREATNNPIKYPMAGMTSENVTLIIYDVATKLKITLQTGEPKEQYLTSVTWDPSGKFIYVGVLNRGQNHLKLNKYDATSGTFVKTLFEEQASTYVEPLHPLLFVPNTNTFLYRSEKEGFEQLYLYNTDGKLLKKLDYNFVIVEDLQGFDAQHKHVYYIGATNNGLDRHLYKVNLISGKTEQLTNISGVHNATVSSDGTMVLDAFSSIKNPNEINIINLKTKKISSVLKAENPYQNKIDLPNYELVSLTAADNKTLLNGRIIYPANFDATKKYPVIVYVYGGPHAQLVSNRWLGGASLFDFYMAQQGYVVFTLDNRGSDARGKDFEHIIHRILGKNEMADQMKGIEFLKSKSFIDTEKIGVYGWSYGGFMSISLMLNHNNIFKVGVAGGPVCDWKYYEIMYGERYMDTPEENPEGYKNTSVIEKANQLNGKLLIIHGAQDPVVVQQHSMNFIEACIKNGKQVDYFLYPNHEHNVRGKDRVHLNQKIADYFETYLK